jgi:hypothetical protein
VSVESLMTQAVTLQVPSGDARDAIGGSVDTYTETATVMYLEPTRGREDMENRNTPIGDWFGVGKASDPFASDVRIVYGDHTFDVIAPPRLFHDPLTGVASHYELSLQEVT